MVPLRLIRAVVFIGAAVTIVVAIPALRAQQQPARDAAAAALQTRSGTALISGVVVDAASLQPLRRVAVVAVEQAAFASGRLSVTDDEGRFVFRSLGAGRYLVTATKAAYLATANGVQKPMRPGPAPTGSAIALKEGQQLTDLMLRMTRGSVVAGMVRGTDGRPVRGATVTLAYSVRSALSGDRTLSTLQSGGATTDARGAYRIFGVPPGDYIVSAAIGSPIVNDLESTTEADVQRITEMSAARSSGLPSTQSSAAANPSAKPTDRRPTYGYAPVFYPGVTSLANATPITLGPGEERGGTDFQIQLVPQSRIAGVVTGVDGRPAAGVPVRVSPVSLWAAGPFSTWSTAITDSQGQFLVRAIPAGEYSLEVRPRAGASPTTSWARSSVSVSPGADVRMNVTLQPGLTVSGQIAIDPASTAAPPDLTRVRLTLTNRDGVGTSAPVTADGRFAFAGVIPEAYRLTYQVPTTGANAGAWFAKSSAIGGRDLLDVMMDLTEDVSGASVVLTTSMSEVSGAILDGAGRPAPEYFIVIFPADRKLWSWQSRRIQQMRPSTDGKFSFKNLPAGDYLIGAVTDVEPNQWFEPAFLTELLGASAPIKLAEGERKVQSIRLR